MIRQLVQAHNTRTQEFWYLKSRNISSKDGELEDFNNSENMGLGIRALVGSSWGFYATYDLSDKSLIEARKKA